MSKRVVCLHSGGLDSTTLLFHLKSMGLEVFPLTIEYGQRHFREIEFAKISCGALGVEHKYINLRPLQSLFKGSSQTDSSVAVPEGHYSADNMAITVVPNRNMVLLSVATAYAIGIKADLVAYAAHIGDHDQYPDCRQVFIDALAAAIKLCDDRPPTLSAPFSGLTKAQIAERAGILNVPVHLTYSCYKGGMNHCGKCGTCVERLEALAIAREALRSTMDFQDQTIYDDKEYWRTVTKTQFNAEHAKAVNKWLE